MKRFLTGMIVLVCIFSIGTVSFGVSYSMCTHGNALQLGKTDQFYSVTRYGNCTTLVGWADSFPCVHFPIPTPLIVNNLRLRAGAVWLTFNTSAFDGRVTGVYVYDGDKQIAAFDNLILYGNVGTVRFTLPDAPVIRQGLNISVAMIFMSQAEIDFVSAGCDFF
jgi:hypothetical protein